MKDYRDCLYWKETGCSGFNCCLEEDCKHSEKYQPWLQKAKQQVSAQSKDNAK